MKSVYSNFHFQFIHMCMQDVVYYDLTKTTPYNLYIQKEFEPVESLHIALYFKDTKCMSLMNLHCCLEFKCQAKDHV